MYSKRPGLVIGFHECDKPVVDKVITGQQSSRESTNNYDWLGSGINFWEWSTSSSQQLTKFHLYHSELYLLTYAYKYKKLNNSKMLTNNDFKNLNEKKS